MIPEIDLAELDARRPNVMAATRRGVEEVGFLTLHNTPLGAAEVEAAIDAYRRFFKGPEQIKAAVDMSVTGSNRGWGAPQSEQVDPSANPDFKEVFDCGVELPGHDPLAQLSVYAPNLWPDAPAGFQTVIESYFATARAISLRLLSGVAAAIGQDEGFFQDKFAKPMALLRGNFYPKRPDWAGEKDSGIAAHTDYGCLTLLATDGEPGLEAQMRDGAWVPIQASPGTFIINFGEMLEMWTGGQVRATPHRVRGGTNERISVPLFFNPGHDTNVAPAGAEPISAGEHLSRRYQETYLHLQKAN